MAAAPKSPGDEGPSAATAFVKKEELDDPPTAKPSPSLLGRLAPVLLFAAGAVLGAYLSSRVIEMEYRKLVATLQADHRAAMIETQVGYANCRARSSKEKHSYQEKVAKLRARVDQTEREFQRRVEGYLSETNEAWRVANEGLDKASSRLKLEIERHESTRLQLSQADKRLAAIRNTVQESKRSMEASESKLGEAELQVRYLQRELDAAEEELDRRDLERAECDENHRNLLQCRAGLDTSTTLASSDEASESVKEIYARLEVITGQRDDLLRQVESMKEKHELQDHLYAEIDERSREIAQEKEYWQKTATEIDEQSREIVQEKEYWETKAKGIMDKVIFRSRKAVLDQFGPGPHHVKLTLSFEDSPNTGAILLRLAPLDDMPHTIHTFLDLVQRKLLVQGTFVLARNHILVGGPIDAHSKENNEALENRMLNEGYFPSGAMLFGEYSAEHPHIPYSLGFNPLGGPIFYFNLQDNTELHGPGYSKEGGYKDGDACFATVADGMDIVQRILDLPKNSDDSLVSPVYIVDTQVVHVI